MSQLGLEMLSKSKEGKMIEIAVCWEPITEF